MPRQQYFFLFDTALGTCGLVWNGVGLTQLQFPQADRAATERRLRARAPDARAVAKPLPWIMGIVEELRAYAAGERIDFSATGVDFADLSTFEIKVLTAARGVGWGQTTTYGELARQVGEPGAAQMVGQAMGRNPIPIIVPCHRVLAAGGRSGGFSAPGGVGSKARLLALEGSRLGWTKPPDTSQQSFDF